MVPERPDTDQKNTPPAASPEVGAARPEEARFLERLRRGDASAGHQLVREYYPGIYRYLLALSERAELAEDLTQETFFQAWRHLDQFQGRAPLGAWLYRIARREFLRAMRSRRSQLSLDELAERAEPRGPAWTDAVELRTVLRSLPREEREAVLLHYLEGYTCQEIARIVQAPVGTVKQRLMTARSHLQHEMGEDDLTYLNEPLAPGTRVAGGRQWAWLPLDQMHTLEDKMERREFLRNAAAGAAGLMLPGEKEIVDDRLTRKVTLAFKATALSELCDHLRSTTGIHLVAGNSVADEKVTIFCQKLPLRDVMRQLSRPFGYAWLRSGRPDPTPAPGVAALLSPRGRGEPHGREAGGGTQSPPLPSGEGAGGRGYRYELAQDLRSQLLEEELRNRDRHQALLALEKEIDRFRPHKDLSPDEALARLKTAPPEEKPLLERLAGKGWGPLQMYFQLSPQDLAALRGGDWLSFNVEPGPGERLLPPDVARGVLQSLRDWRIVVSDDGFTPVFESEKAPDGRPPVAVPEVRARVMLRMNQSELGQFVVEGMSGAEAYGKSHGFLHFQESGPLAIGANTAAGNTHLRTADPRIDRDPALRRRVTVRPAHGCDLPEDMRRSPSGVSPASSHDRTPDRGPKVTTADVLEALHRATGMPVVGDYYTRLVPAKAVAVQDQPLIETLKQLTEPTRLRWNKDGTWLQFRSRTYYDDRLKEVPNRLLSRWSAARGRQGSLSLDDLCEIAGLPDAQLDGTEMAEGARNCFGLAEWELASSRHWRSHLRFLAGFSPAQRQEAMSPTGLAFTKMPLAQQQVFLSMAYDRLAEGLKSLEEIAGATLFVDYSQPGGFEWRMPGADWLRWVTSVEPGKRAPRQPVRARTREATLEAARQVDPRVREALLRAARQSTPRPDESTLTLEEAQIVPTELDLAFIYLPGASHQRAIRAVYRHNDRTWSTW